MRMASLIFCLTFSTAWLGLDQPTQAQDKTTIVDRLLDRSRQGEDPLRVADRLQVDRAGVTSQPPTTQDSDAADLTDEAIDDEMEDDMDDDLLLPNLPLPTMGGKQFWTDHRWHNGWRLQHNVMTDHWRVVDPKNTRRAWGGRLACQKVFDEACGKDIACAKHVVVLIHGLMRTTGSMKALAEAIKQETDMQPAAFGYSSTRDSIARHSAAFRDWVENLPGEPQISIVGHSLGNIVTRHAIGEWQLEDPRGVLKRLDRVVMLGPPNNGSSLAKKLSRLGLFEVVTGQSGLELGPQWDKMQSRLGIPPCEFAIISGDMSESSLRNPLTPAEGDLVVTVEETCLPGAQTLTVPVLHSFLPNDARAVQPTIRFLKHESLEGE